MPTLVSLSFLIISICGPVRADLYPLPEVEAPHSICIDGDCLFVAEKSRVCVYRLPHNFVRAFGKKGEGPGEFMEFTDLGLEVYPAGDEIAVASNGRLSWFSRRGDFLREIRTGGGLHFRPVHERFVAIRIQSYSGRMVHSVTLFEKNLAEIKVLARKPYWFLPGEKIDPVNVGNPRFCVMNHRIYAENAVNGAILIYDSEGRPMGSAQADYPRIKISEADKREYHRYYRTHKYYRDKYAQLKHLIQFPKYYPPIKYFDCADGCIYVFSHLREKGANQLYVFNAEGSLQRRLMVPMPDIDSRDLLPLVRIANGHIYQILEDPENETWSLHIAPIPGAARSFGKTSGNGRKATP